MGRINPLIAIGIPSWGTVSLTWARAYRHLGGMLGASMIEMTVENKPIAAARNELMLQAFAHKCDFLFFLGDDVLPPGDAVHKLWTRMQADPDLHLVTGVYWTKGWPTHPYLWRGMQRGPYIDWKMGEFFEVDYAGCDCLLMRLSPELEALGPEWFSTDWVWEPDQAAPDAGLATEDFYFYTKARKAGLRLWCDTGVQCLHEDRTSRLTFGLTTDMPQAGGELRSLPDAAVEGMPVRVADIGSGKDTPYFGPDCEVVRFDADEAVRPEYRCDVRRLPVPDRCFDVVHSRHVLEHFGRAEVPAVLREWLRVLRVGGELRLSVPNVAHAAERLLGFERGDEGFDQYAGWQLYGQQVDQRDYHRTGFTPKILRRLLEQIGGLRNIQVVTAGGGINVEATATKAVHSAPLALVPEWDAIMAAEGAAMAGVSPPPSPAAEPDDSLISADVIEAALADQLARLAEVREAGACVEAD